MSYYPDYDGLRCDRCLRAAPFAVRVHDEDLCVDCEMTHSNQRIIFVLTCAVSLMIIGALLWVLYSLPPTFD
jgi:hypothetical protein